MRRDLRQGTKGLKISNTRLPKLYFADAANLLLQYNLKRIEPLSLRGMSGQDKQGTMEFRGEEEAYSEFAEGDPRMPSLSRPNICDGGSAATALSWSTGLICWL
jgi:hypothetical protein